MRILLQTASANAGEWHAAFAAALPEAEIALWPDAARAVDYLAVWIERDEYVFLAHKHAIGRMLAPLLIRHRIR